MSFSEESSSLWLSLLFIIARKNYQEKPASVKPAYKLGKRNVPDKTYTQEPAGKQGALRPCAEFWRSTGSLPGFFFRRFRCLRTYLPKKKTLERDVILRSSDTLIRKFLQGMGLWKINVNICTRTFLIYQLTCFLTVHSHLMPCVLCIPS